MAGEEGQDLGSGSAGWTGEKKQNINTAKDYSYAQCVLVHWEILKNKWKVMHTESDVH